LRQVFDVFAAGSRAGTELSSKNIMLFNALLKRPFPDVLGPDFANLNVRSNGWRLRENRGGQMGASKINLDTVESVQTADLRVLRFALGENDACRLVLDQPVDEGELVLIKASFKVSVDSNNEDEDPSLVRRRVVPFLARVSEVTADDAGKLTQVVSVIEKILDDDRRFFFDHYFGNLDAETQDLEFEAKHIHFNPA